MQANPKQAASFGSWGRRWPSTQYVVRHSFDLSKHHALLRKRACNRVSVHFPVLEAAAAAAVQAVDEQPPCLNYAEVNRHNFKAVLPVLRTAIQEATFVAIDTEFTGLAPYGSSYPDDSLDDYEERYKRLLAAADNFVICQYGLSAFKWHTAPGAPHGGYWEAKTFNAYIFPRSDVLDKRFLCQASSLTYLAEQGFDFNKMIYDGIGFLPMDVREARVRGLREEANRTQRTRQTRTLEEEELEEDARGRVLSWLLGEEPELLLALPRTRRLQRLLRLLLQDEFQVPSLGYDPFSIDLCSASPAEGGGVVPGNAVAGVAGTAAAEMSGVGGLQGEGAHDGVLDEEVGSDGEATIDEGAESSPEVGSEQQANTFMRLRRLDQWRPGSLIARGQQLTPRQKIEMLLEKSGFSQVLDILRESGRPLVGHNAALDLAYTLSQFYGDLPRNWRAYKALLQRCFPGSVYDTKHIAMQLLSTGVQLGDTSLGNLYRTLTDEAWLRANVAGAGLPAALGGGVPEIRHAPGFTGYMGVSVEKAHEAGFDSFMTGSAFVRLLRLVDTKTAMHAGGVFTDVAVSDSAAASPSSVDSDALLLPLGPYRGRVHMVRTDLLYADMYGNDPVPSRPEVIYVEGFGPQTRAHFVTQRFSSIGFKPLHVSVLTGPGGDATGALVQLHRADSVSRVMQEARKRYSSWTVMTFAEYYRKRLQPQHRMQQQQVQRQQAWSSGAAAGALATSPVGRAAPRLIRSTAAEVEGGPAVPRNEGLGGSVRQVAAATTAGGAAGDKSQREDEEAKARSAASSSTEGAPQLQRTTGLLRNERQRLQTLTRSGAAAASASGTRAVGRKSGELTGLAPTAAVVPESQAEGAASSSAAFTSQSTAVAAGGMASREQQNARYSAADSPHVAGRNGDCEDAADASESDSSEPSDESVAEGEAAAQRAAERLRNLAQAAQRLKSLATPDGLSRSAADSSVVLTLHRPARPGR